MFKLLIRLTATAWMLCAVAPAAAACDHPRRWKPSIEELKRQEAAYLAPLPPGFAESPVGGPSACNADLRKADLSGLTLHAINLANSDLSGSDLSNAQFSMSDFEGANLAGANATGANFAFAHMARTNLIGANLGEASLSGTDLTGADLRNANLAGAIIEGANLTNAYFEPRGAPPARVSRLIGLESVRFQDSSGIAQLRQLARESGARDIERAATFAIEHERTQGLGGDELDDWFGYRPYRPMIEGLFRRIAFEWTTGYGLYPGRALQLIFLFVVLLIPLYAWVASSARSSRAKAAIYRILPADRINAENETATVENPIVVERLSLPVARAIGWGAYFSFLSAFNIGFRDLNVGNWISRVQPSKFQLDSLGWVRTLSGLQSLLSLYLLAMWLLTYFGRPFD